MKITIIAGSHRENSESERIGKYISKELTSMGMDSYLFSLSKNPLPLWDEGQWSNAEPWASKWQPISKELESSDGFVVIAPEWAGMVPAGLKNFFLLASNKELAHKPALIVGVSSGVSGTYPVAELRSSSYKNNRICYIPDHVIIRDCTKMLKDESPSNDHDKSIRERLTYSLKVLLEYSKALAEVRKSAVIDYKTFPYGM
jgi:NAD(P)H-dependent FMN reductase